MIIDWDDSIHKLTVEWNKTCENLKQYEEIVIKRYCFIYDLSEMIKEIYLHGISDALQRAYAACIYLKLETQRRSFAVKFVTAKSRVTLIKKLFIIPRLEFLGSYIYRNLFVMFIRVSATIFNLKIFYVGVIYKFH